MVLLVRSDDELDYVAWLMILSSEISNVTTVKSKGDSTVEIKGVPSIKRDLLSSHLAMQELIYNSSIFFLSVGE